MRFLYFVLAFHPNANSYRTLVNLGSFLMIMKSFSQHLIIISVKRGTRGVPNAYSLGYLPKRHQKTHSVIKALESGNVQLEHTKFLVFC